ncbi:hypothetical protein BpHYR1_024704 [Brachionus plicatilis]|uniref:Uncharacterized protein n=1 Tax=Brachionus plicatilis TaxID=10195 RepID=A0A3M7SB84_BRAPC|nr:hypothetical protein BpHYR1_024704 [Brachionus plicatilis]
MFQKIAELLNLPILFVLLLFVYPLWSKKLKNFKPIKSLDLNWNNLRLITNKIRNVAKPNL